jgi:hypothetical protein
LLLPLMLMMDAVGLWTWRGQVDRSLLVTMLPAAILGIGVGWLTAAATPEALVRLIVGLVALAFVLRSVRPSRAAVAPHPSRLSAWFWGSLAGFTSFVAHAGGPPYQVHALPLRLGAGATCCCTQRTPWPHRWPGPRPVYLPAFAVRAGPPVGSPPARPPPATSASLSPLKARM